MADPVVDTTGGSKGKLSAWVKKHKALTAVLAIVGVVLIYFIIRFYSGSQQNAANNAATTSGSSGLTSSGIAGTGPIDLTGTQGPAGPPGPPGKKGPTGKRGPTGKPPTVKKKKKTNHNGGPAKHTLTMPPMHQLPTHTSGQTLRPDTSHAVKSRETNVRH